MITHYTEEELKGRKHLFVSYSHGDTIVQQAVNYLLNEGVQLWYDRDLHNRENWQVRVENVLENPNCVGVIFFNSKNSFSSKAVDFEREQVIKKIKKSAENGEIFKVFVVHIGNHSITQFVKRVLDEVSDDGKAIDAVMDTEKLFRIIQLFNDKDFYSYIDDSSLEENIRKFFYMELDKNHKELIDKNHVALDSVHDFIAEKDNSAITMKFGSRQGEPLVWRLFKCEGDDWIFLLDSVLCKRIGGEPLIEWLNGEFKSTAFNESEKAVMEKPLRLLSLAEAEQTKFDYLAKDDQWWLADTNGTLQLTVRVNGTIYMNGHQNENNEKGVRPVLVLKSERAQQIIKK